MRCRSYFAGYFFELAASTNLWIALGQLALLAVFQVLPSIVPKSVIVAVNIVCSRVAEVAKQGTERDQTGGCRVAGHGNERDSARARLNGRPAVTQPNEKANPL